MVINQLLIFSFSLIGVILFVVNYKNCKKYLPKYEEIFGIVGIVFLIYWLIMHFFYEYPIGLYKLAEVVLRFLRNIILATLATYYFNDKLIINPAPLLVIKDKTVDSQKYALTVLLFYAASVLIAITILFINGSDIILERNVSLNAGILAVVGSFLEGFQEEVFVRLFLFGLLINLFGKSSLGVTVSIVISSFIWSINHFIAGISLIRFVLIFLLGILWGILMYKKGIESTVLVHGLYNTTAYLVLGTLT